MDREKKQLFQQRLAPFRQGGVAPLQTFPKKKSGGRQMEATFQCTLEQLQILASDGTKTDDEVDEFARSMAPATQADIREIALVIDHFRPTLAAKWISRQAAARVRS